MTELIVELSGVLLRIAIVFFVGLLTKYALPWLKDVVVPWLKERQLYNLICYFVRAAEKLADTGTISKDMKKDYVIGLLESRGVAITKEVNALIESAVMELDMAVAGAFDAIFDTITETAIETEVEITDSDDEEAQ